MYECATVEVVKVSMFNSYCNELWNFDTNSKPIFTKNDSVKCNGMVDERVSFSSDRMTKNAVQLNWLPEQTERVHYLSF